MTALLFIVLPFCMCVCGGCWQCVVKTKIVGSYIMSVHVKKTIQKNSSVEFLACSVLNVESHDYPCGSGISTCSL